MRHVQQHIFAVEPQPLCKHEHPLIDNLVNDEAL